MFPTTRGRRKPLLRFFALAFGATWASWAAALAVWLLGGRDQSLFGLVSGALFLLGVFAPGLTAVALTDRLDGRAATRALLGRIFRWDVGLRWYVFAIAFIPAIELATAVAHRLLVGDWPAFGPTPLWLMAAALLVSTWVQAGEEVGWRGYALPRLAERLGLGPASLLLGTIWAAWHLPLFLVPIGDLAGQSFPLYLLQVTALSVLMAWLYWRAGGSLLLVMLFHASVNNSKDIVPSAVGGSGDAWLLGGSLVAWITVALLWAAAAYCLGRMRGVRVLRGEARERDLTDVEELLELEED